MEDYKKQFLESGVLDEIKTQEELSELLNGLHTAALEAMLHGEMDALPGLSKKRQERFDQCPQRYLKKEVEVRFWGITAKGVP